MADAHCPICQCLLAADAPRPFCSARCRQIDLARWLDGNYRIAGQPLDSAPAVATQGEEEN
jgi:endogenous inhibitor of DNA gyrase (YacG/DUF329 family)